jgi:hypothetical protein
MEILPMNFTCQRQKKKHLPFTCEMLGKIQVVMFYMSILSL